MIVTVLYVEDCPHAAPLLAELHRLLDGRRDAVCVATLVTSDDEAAALGFHGSPTVLVDGIDPFPAPPEPVGLSCRVYPHGTASGLPSTEELAAALAGTG